MRAVPSSPLPWARVGEGPSPAGQMEARAQPAPPARPDLPAPCACPVQRPPTALSWARDIDSGRRPSEPRAGTCPHAPRPERVPEGPGPGCLRGAPSRTDQFPHEGPSRSLGQPGLTRQERVCPGPVPSRPEVEVWQAASCRGLSVPGRQCLLPCASARDRGPPS